MTVLLLAVLLSVPADTLSLAAAHEAAVAHYPRVRESEIALAIADLRVRNLDAKYLPEIGFGAQATYQSAVPELPFQLPGADPVRIPHDQYRAGLSVNQLVYDGGVTAALKEIERMDAAVTVQEIAVETYGIRDRVEAAWFAVLLSDAERASLDILIEDLDARLAQTRSLVQRGVATASNVEVLEAERIRAGQQRAAAVNNRRAGLDVLQIVTGWSLPDDAELGLPIAPAPDSLMRPELTLFRLSRDRLADRATMVDRRTRPRLVGFVDAAFGRPQGANIFADDFGPFVTLGVRLSWPFWDWRASDRERQAVYLQSDAVSAREASFRQGVDAAAAQVRRTIRTLEANLASDADIVELRSRIASEARSRLDNGTITATDYLVERNAEHGARLSLDVHRIQLAQARARLATILGAS